MPAQALGIFLIVPIIGMILYSVDEVVWGILLISIYIPALFIKKSVVLDYKNNSINFYTGWFSNQYNASKFQKCKIKVYTKSYGNTVGNGIGYSEQYYSIANKALYVADVVNKEEKLIKIGKQKELVAIAKEMETNFGIIRV